MHFVLLFSFIFSHLGLTAEVKAETADTVLVLAIDASESVRIEANGVDEYAIQKDGIRWALTHPDVVDTARACKVAIQYVEWSGANQDQPGQKVVVDWRVVREKADFLKLAADIHSSPRAFAYMTDLYAGLEFAANQAEAGAKRFSADRKVIVVSSDGKQNVITPDAGDDGAHPARLQAQRDRFGANGISVSALVIENDISQRDLFDYYRENVITGTGTGGFALPVVDFYGYGEALRKALVREMCNVAM